MMETWKQFLDSLSSRGGSIFMLMLCSAILGAAAIRYPLSSLDTTFAGFTGALLMALTNSGKASSGTDTTMVSTSPSVSKPEQTP